VGAGARGVRRGDRARPDAIRDHFAANLEIAVVDFEYAPFVTMGGVGGATRVFGDRVSAVVLVA